MTTPSDGLLGGRYDVGEIIGRGGMATVRRAHDTRLGRDVAIKQLRVDLASDATFQERFRREAQAAAGLNHPNIVAVYDTGESTDATTGTSVPYIVMELVEGRTLRDILRDGRPILPRRALEFTLGVLDALAYSHRSGIVHRDIKPANVMITPTGMVKVMDFGIARAVADTSSTMTQTAAVIGTAQYLSPEQARGETVDHRSDLYSAGCLLYELLVGRPPFQGDSPVSVAYQHVREMPQPPSELDAEITPAMDAVVLKALAKSTEDRYSTAGEMSADIRRLLAGQDVTAVAPPPPVYPVPSSASSAVSATSAPTASYPVWTQDKAGFSQPVETTGSTATLALPTGGAAAPARRRGGWLWPLLTGILLIALLAGTAFLVLSQNDTSVTVPQVVGRSQSAAENALTDRKLKPQVVPVVGPADDSVGKVTAQSPDAAAKVPAGSTVQISVNLGPTKSTIPSDLVGKDVAAAAAQLDKLGFKLVRQQPDPSNEKPEDKANEVLRVEPAMGSVIPPGQPITLYFAEGRAVVPNVVTYTEENAVKKLQLAGFTNVRTRTQATDDKKFVGKALSTDPSAETTANKADPVFVTIGVAAQAPPTVTTTVYVPPSSTRSTTSKPPVTSSSAAPSSSSTSTSTSTTSTSTSTPAPPPTSPAPPSTSAPSVAPSQPSASPVP